MFSCFWLCLSPFLSLTLTYLKSVFLPSNVGNIWHTDDFPHANVKAMNLPKGSPVEVRYYVTRAFLVPLHRVYICVYVYKDIWTFSLFSLFKVQFWSTWYNLEIFYFIKYMRESFFGFTKGAEEKKALLQPFSERCTFTGSDEKPEEWDPRENQYPALQRFV